MIKFKPQYENSILSLPNKISIHRHNIAQYEALMKERYPDMIEEFQDNTEDDSKVTETSKRVKATESKKPSTSEEPKE